MIYLGADRHGFKVIQIVKNWLEANHKKYTNLGVSTEQDNISLEELLPVVAAETKKDPDNLAIISCGSGIGVEVGINKFSGIRASLATDPEIAAWSKIYDKCNVLCLAGWRTDRETIEKILAAWFQAEYDGSEKRLQMFKAFDSWH